MESDAAASKNELFNIVFNHEEQYSIWPVLLPLPAGWTVFEKPASREECLDRIAEVWTDITPKSVREAIAKHRVDADDDGNSR